jgi:SAM-dependent methyltransferase
MKQLISTDNYKAYREKQWKEIDRLYELKLFSKHVDIISELSIDENYRKESHVLCIGARYGIEVEVFKQLGFTNISAIDIYPRSENVIEADMHNMPFLDNYFDIIYTHHSLDHSLFPEKAVNEMYRVSKKSAFWIHTIPFDDYGKEEAIDFDSPNEIISFLKKYTTVIVYKQEVTRNSNGFIEPVGFCLPKGWKNEFRIILKINKK